MPLTPGRDVLLELWKTAGRQNRLEDACPSFVQYAAHWGKVDRLLIVRWESDLGFLEPLVDISANNPPDNPGHVMRKQKCEPATIAELKTLFDDRTTLRIDRLSQLPPRFTELFSSAVSHEAPLWLGLLNPGKLSEVFLLLEMQSDGEKFDATKNAMSFAEFFFECMALLTAVLERESMIRRLNQQREAVEAEKAAVLAKFGRQDINTETVIGIEHGLKRVFERLDMIAATGTPVLLIGETGSGKALIARAIHNRSGRASSPFLRFNCGAVSPELLESQLFGGREPGAFERVNGGTLFLNDVHLLTATAQSRLLDLVDRGMINRPNAKQSRMIDVRVIVATDRDLSANVAEANFDETLWYRLALFPIRIPTLRERLDDLPELARYFVRRAASRFGLPPVLPTEYDIEFLKSYSWPGNVRELGTVVDRAALLGNGKSLDVRTALGVPVDAILAPEENAGERFRQTRRRQWAAFQTVEPLDELVRRYLEYVLGVTGGKVDGPNGAAGLLDVNPNTLRSKLKKSGIDPRDFKNL